MTDAKKKFIAEVKKEIEARKELDGIDEEKKIKSLSRDVIEELIDCIYVHEGGNITVKFKYQDEYER